MAVPMAEVEWKSRATVKNGATVEDFESKQAGGASRRSSPA
jgi:hypothetical protein